MTMRIDAGTGPRRPRGRRVLFPAVCLLTALFAVAATAQTRAPGALFPRPFVIEHQLVQHGLDGSTFAAPTVTDTYGGSWIVSVREDGSRLIVDLARGELTEIRPARGTWWSVSFDRFADLRSRLAAIDGGVPTAAAADERGAALGSPTVRSPAVPAADGQAPAVRVIEAPTGESGGDAISNRAAAARLAQPGVRHLRVEVSVGGAAEVAMDVWVDTELRLGPSALVALESFEQRVLAPAGGAAPRTLPPAALLAAARSHAGGALPVRTLRRLVQPDGRPAGSLEDRALRWEALDRFPVELVEIPDGFSRVPHPLESLVALGEDAASREALVGNPSGGSPGVSVEESLEQPLEPR